MNSPKNVTGAPLHATSPSLTMFELSVERSELLMEYRSDVCPAAAGKPGNDGSRLFSVSG